MEQTNTFLRVDDVARELDVSASYAYKIIRKLNAELEKKGIRDLTKPTIMELIKRGRCICGQEIREGNDSYQHLMAELAYVPPESIGNTVRHYREKLASFSRPAERAFDSIDQRYKEILRLKSRIQE